MRSFRSLQIALIAIIASTAPAEAQIWKKVKEKAKEVIDGEAVQKTEELLRNAIRCAFDDNACIEKAKAADQPVVLTDKQGKVLTDEKGAPITDPAQLPAAQQAEKAAGPSPQEPLQVPKIALANIDRSWVADTAAKRWKNYFFSQMDLWSVETDALVAEKSSHGFGPRLIAGRPDLMLFEGRRPPAWGFANEWSAVFKPGTRGPHIALEMCIPPYACEKRAIQARARAHGPYLAKDFRRVLYFEKGDLWRADLDWLAGSIVNRKQVTQVGLLNDVTPLHWYRNTLYLRGKLSQEKPIIRIDLKTGALEELPTMGIFVNTFANPAGHRLCAQPEEKATLRCYDLRTGKFAEITLPRDPVKTHLLNLKRFNAAEADSPDNFLWADAETLVSDYLGIRAIEPGFKGQKAGSPAVPSGLVRIDFRTGKADILAVSRILEEKFPENIARIELLPGKRHVAVDFSYNAPKTGSGQRKVRVAIEDGSVVELPDVPHEGTWLDDEQFFYSISTGGISQIGTWIHDVATGKKSKVCHVPAVAHPTHPESGFEPAVRLFSERKALYFMAGGNGARLFKSDLATGKCRDLKTRNSLQEVWLSWPRTPPIDLRLGVSGDALW